MQTIPARGRRRGRIAFYVPRWIPADASPSGMPYKVFPVLSSLARHGFEVDFGCELFDAPDGAEVAGALDRADGACVWLAELNPGVQLPGAVAFLECAAARAPAVPRLAGGGFLALLPRDNGLLGELAPLTLDDSGVGSLAGAFDERLGLPPGCEGVEPGRREPYDVRAVRDVDLTPFLRPESMIFRNDRPALQVPTGYGCAKHCGFCFYERTNALLLPADELVDTVAALVRRYGVRQFLMGELDFLAHRRRAVDVAARLVERDLDVGWFALVSVGDLAQLSDDDLALLARSGCRALEIGSEVGSNAALEALGKRFEVADAVEQTQRVVAHGIRAIHNVLFGWVGESPAERRRTIALARRLRRLGERDHFNFRHYQAIPGTSMGTLALEHAPPLPATLADLERARSSPPDERALPWLGASDEEEVKLLTEYVLPLAYDDALQVGRPGPVRRALAAVARLRCALGFFRWPLDRALFRRLESVGLPGTYLP